MNPYEKNYHYNSPIVMVFAFVACSSNEPVAELTDEGLEQVTGGANNIGFK